MKKQSIIEYDPGSKLSMEIKEVWNGLQQVLK